MTKKTFWWGIGILLLIAWCLRFFKLGEVPHGMTWDEAAIGYNGFAIFTTRRDEWLTRLPASFWSFGDYKAPLAIYANGFFTYLFGMTLFAVRVPFALAGVAAIFGLIKLTELIFKMAGEADQQARVFGLLAGALITLSPWHHHFSRVGFESGLALTLVIWGLYFFHRALTVKETWRRYIDWLWTVLAFVGSLYAYHSAKIAVPLLVIGLVWIHRQRILKHWLSFTLASVIGLLTLRPLVYDSLFGKGLERAGTLIFSQDQSWLETLSLFWQQLLVHLSPAFLIFGETNTLRHGDGQWGVLYPTTLLFVLVALVAAFKKASRTYPFWLAMALLVFGLLPAALGKDVPHANRALLALPGFLLLAILGWRAIAMSAWSEAVKRATLGTAVLLHGLLFATYINNYYTNFAANSAEAFQDGYLEAFHFALPYERGEAGKTAVDKIIFTGDYGQPYIYALFARETNPIWYQGGSLIKYEFKDEITIGDLERPNTLVVASQTDELLSRNDQADEIVYGSDGSIRFRIYLNQ